MPETTHFPSELGDNERVHTGRLKANFVLHNRYKIMGEIGGGGMGTVYQARDLKFTDVRKLVAIKEMQTTSTNPAVRDQMLRTFHREANLLATLSHPAIPQILDIFDLDERAYIVMEYINGNDLELLLQKTKELPIDKIIEWAIDLCDVLQYLHNQQPNPIVFRDVKPSNVMIDAHGKIRLIDFGIAKTLQVGSKGHTMIGTEGYSAPEQYKGDVTPQSDIYSLGATLHHILTRRDPRLEAPFTFNERPIANFNPKVPPGLITIVERALSMNADERFKSMQEMRDALEQLRYRPLNMGAASPAMMQETNGGNGAATFAQEIKDSGSVQPRWKFKTEDEIRSSPTATSDLAFIGSYDTNIYAVKLNDGEFVWKNPTAGGIAAAPVIDDGSKAIVFGSEDSRLYSIDYRSKQENWKVTTKDRIRSTPRIAHNYVFVGSDDGCVYAVAVQTGRQQWRYEVGAPIRVRPFVTNDLVIVGAESGEVLALNLSGTQRKWTYRTKRPIMSSPYVDKDGICYVGSNDGFVYAIDVNTGFNSWRFRTNGQIISSPVESKGLLYFGSTDGILYALNTQNSRERWKFNTEKPIVASPIVHQGWVYFGGTDGTFYCVNAETGKERWRYKTGGAITGTPYVAGDVILIGSMDHYLYAFPLVN